MPDRPARGLALTVDPDKLGGTLAEIRAMVDRAQRGDESALPAIRKYLDRAGADALGGDLARRAADLLLAAHCGDNLLFREATSRKLADLRAELAGPTPSPVERLLADRAACCWLHLHHLEAVYAGKSSLTLPLDDHYQKQIDRAHRRYLSALKALADVRRLAGPSIRVNIARKQVNVAGPSTPAT